MSRRDLDELRATIASAGGLTNAERRAIQYWGEERLIETLYLFAAVAEADDEYDAAVESETDDERDIVDDYRAGYYDDPDYGIWEVEIDTESDS